MAVREKATPSSPTCSAAFSADPSRMPEEWSAGLDGRRAGRIARRIADYIAGMTDTYAVLAHRRLYAATPDLHWDPPSRGLPLAEP